VGPAPCRGPLSASYHSSVGDPVNDDFLTLECNFSVDEAGEKSLFGCLPIERRCSGGTRSHPTNDDFLEKKKMKAKTAISLVTAILLSGCAASAGYSPAPGEKMHVSQGVMDYYNTSYLQTIGTTHPGAFAVSRSGVNAVYSYCDETVCKSGFSYGQQAITGCESHGEPCYLFAAGRDIKVEYVVVP
jgi:hypothetical protein